MASVHILNNSTGYSKNRSPKWKTSGDEEGSLMSPQYMPTLLCMAKGICRLWDGEIILDYPSEPNLVTWVETKMLWRRKGQRNAQEDLHGLLLALKKEEGVWTICTNLQDLGITLSMQNKGKRGPKSYNHKELNFANNWISWTDKKILWYLDFSLVWSILDFWPIRLQD